MSAQSPPLLGGILLIIGNVVGAGILALPLATVQLGLPYSIFLIIFFWLLMMLGAYYFLEANLVLPANTNLVSMSRMAFGKWGVILAWVCNLLVMYSLIAAYIAGGGDLIKVNGHYLGIDLPSWLTAPIFLLIFGYIVSQGIRMTDHVNRILILLKMLLFFTVTMY